MIKHDQLWRAMDRFADHYGLTTSGLAKAAGLDPTSFNPSKRTTKEGKKRWPNSESIAKVLEATGGTMVEFVSYLQDVPGAVLSQDIPYLTLEEAIGSVEKEGEESLFDDHGYPVRDNWDFIVYPDVNDAHAFGLEITDDSLSPVYRSGTILVTSPNASIRRNDRVLLCMETGEIIVRELVRQTAHRMDIVSILGDRDVETIMADQVSWVSRIVWASQ